MPLYAVTIEAIVKTWMRVQIEAPHEDTASDLAIDDYDRGPDWRLTWVLVGADGSGGTSVRGA